MAEGARPKSKGVRTALWFAGALAVLLGANRLHLGATLIDFVVSLFDDIDTKNAVARLGWLISAFVQASYMMTFFFASVATALGAAGRALVRARVRASFSDPLDRVRAFVAARPRLTGVLSTVPALLWVALCARIFGMSRESWDTLLAGLALPGVVAFLVQTALVRVGLRGLIAPTLSAEEASGEVRADGFTFNAVAVTTETVGAIGAVAALSVVMFFLTTSTASRNPAFGAVMLAYLALAGGSAILFRRASRISVGLDGIHVSGSARERFIPFREIDGARERSNTIELFLGNKVVLRLQLHGEDASRRGALTTRINEAIKVAEAQRNEPAVEFVASASSDALDRAAGGVSSYREAAPTREKLWQVLESPAVDAAGRKAAATALVRDGTEAERVRLRVAADQCAEPSVRARIEELLEVDETEEPATALKVRRA